MLAISSSIWNVEWRLLLPVGDVDWVDVGHLADDAGCREDSPHASITFANVRSDDAIGTSNGFTIELFVESRQSVIVMCLT